MFHCKLPISEPEPQWRQQQPVDQSQYYWAVVVDEHESQQRSFQQFSLVFSL